MLPIERSTMLDGGDRQSKCFQTHQDRIDGHRGPEFACSEHEGTLRNRPVSVVGGASYCVCGVFPVQCEPLPRLHTTLALASPLLLSRMCQPLWKPLAGSVQLDWTFPSVKAQSICKTESSWYFVFPCASLGLFTTGVVRSRLRKQNSWLYFPNMQWKSVTSLASLYNDHSVYTLSALTWWRSPSVCQPILT